MLSLMCCCRVVGSPSLARASALEGSMVSPPRMLSRIFTYDPTRSASSDSRQSYAAFHSLSDVEMAEVGCSVNSVAVDLF